MASLRVFVFITNMQVLNNCLFRLIGTKSKQNQNHILHTLCC